MMARGLTAKEITEIVDSGILDDEIIKALEEYLQKCQNIKYGARQKILVDADFLKDVLNFANRQKAEIEYLQKKYIPEIARATKRTDELAFEEMRKTARVQEENERYKHSIRLLEKDVQTAKSEAIKELSEKITEVFLRYAHLHSYAEGARKDYIETVDGKEIEMQSVWDVITLQKNGMAEYEEMSRLQKNIETIEKERLLTELEKDFRLLVKEMVGEKDV